MRALSLEGKLAAALGLAIAGAALAGAWLSQWLQSVWFAAALTLALLLLPALLFARSMARPVTDLIRALSGSVLAFRDGDFSFSIANRRRDELGALVAAHNELGQVLREQRQGLFQRELLLDTVVQNTPNAVLLVDPGGFVVYANLAARQLLHGGRDLKGVQFVELMAGAPAAMAQALDAGVDALFSLPLDGEEESFHLARREFTLQGRPHRLYLLRRMTRELSRQEVAIWKKLIRVISHELNNSLAPIQSLAHSGRQLAQRGDLQRLELVFDTIEERARHLGRFIAGYASFARLPQPRLEEVAWPQFLIALSGQYPFVLTGELPATPAHFDRGQVEQLMINLLKNAHESGSDVAEVEVSVELRAAEWRIEVRDHGPGMSESVLANALLPFYSTKRDGTGLGLALVREITEAHGGRVILANRAEGGLSVTVVLPQRPI